jgi:hypothetical protein
MRPRRFCDLIDFAVGTARSLHEMHLADLAVKYVGPIIVHKFSIGIDTAEQLDDSPWRESDRVNNDDKGSVASLTVFNGHNKGGDRDPFEAASSKGV